MLVPSILHESVTFQNMKPCPNVTNPCRMLVPSILHESVTFQNMKPCPKVTNPCGMLFITVVKKKFRVQTGKLNGQPECSKILKSAIEWVRNSKSNTYATFSKGPG